MEEEHIAHVELVSVCEAWLEQALKEGNLVFAFAVSDVIDELKEAIANEK